MGHRREFRAGLDTASFAGITEIGPNDQAAPTDPTRHGDWVNKVIVHGDPALRDRIMHLLNAHGMGGPLPPEMDRAEPEKPWESAWQEIEVGRVLREDGTYRAIRMRIPPNGRFEPKEESKP
jgi:hypothetical protein